jgi:hypothetical protein
MLIFKLKKWCCLGIFTGYILDYSEVLDNNTFIKKYFVEARQILGQ